ncbi:MAG: protein tyrosine phosphatase [Crocinitomicaceae bacterium]|nr:protein tyrosine phosphatase [Crocinitomicaceae bacterium]|tara:strand:+ start:2023 stop:2448 length:426 start_codon:yes stop_codon:yes gene_type:complete
MDSQRPNNILVLCTGNSCRSQIAHGFLKSLAPNDNIYSAGIEIYGINPKAIKAMSEVGVDISLHTSNHIQEYNNIEFDHIITVCDHAAENCPHLSSNAQRHHFNFPDPAKALGSEKEINDEFREVRNKIEKYVKQFIHDYC